MPQQQPTTLRETLRRGARTRDWIVDARPCPALAARGVIAAGYTHLDVGYEVVRVRPDFPHVGACCGGRVDYLVGDGTWARATPGTVLVAPAGVAHGSRSARGHRDSAMAWVLFQPPRSPARPAHRWDVGAARLLHGRDHRPLWWALHGLYVEASGPRRDAAALGHWADLVVGEATRLAGEHDDGHRALRHAWEAVDADLARDWSAEALAGLAGLSETHFRRQCRTHLGRSPGRQLAHLRMQRAALLLTTTDHKIAAVAAAVGYENAFAFSVAFKRWSGCPPADYRSSVAEQVGELR